MARYHVELLNKTSGCVLKDRTVATEIDAAAMARLYINSIKDRGNVVAESSYDISPRGFVIGQTLYTDKMEYVISTGIAS